MAGVRAAVSGHTSQILTDKREAGAFDEVPHAPDILMEFRTPREDARREIERNEKAPR